MPNPAIPRDRVHALAEACSDDGVAFQPVAMRLIKEQRRLSRFFESNMADMGPMPGQVALYMLSVVLRIFEQCGGRLKKVSGAEIEEAIGRVQGVADQLLPADGGVPERARAIDWRAQPHILDEVLWALYERDDKEKKEGEVDLEDPQSFMVYLMLWAAVETLDASWTPSAGASPVA
jgi:hypothetical protein